jgi:hypothetical protein
VVLLSALTKPITARTCPKSVRPPSRVASVFTLSMELNNTTVAEALNAIAKAYRNAVWVLVKNEWAKKLLNQIHLPLMKEGSLE